MQASSNEQTSEQTNGETETKRKVFKSQKTKNHIIKSESSDFESMTREQLVSEATRLSNHVFQLKNLIEKSNGTKNENEARKFKERPFDFDKYHKRHVFLKFAYLGWNYQVCE